MSRFSTIDAAHEYTLDVIAELEAGGILVTRQPSKARDNPELVAQYARLDRLLPEKWLHITFHIASNEQRDEVYAAHQGLIWAGVGFDSGGMTGHRDWEIDFSFQIKEEIDADHEHTVSHVESLIRSHGDEEGT